jgi:hypothetical protein
VSDLLFARLLVNHLDAVEQPTNTTITQEELADTYRQSLALSSREDKRLYSVLAITADGYSTTFEVWHGSVMIRGGGLAECIRAYNQIGATT